MTAFIVTRESLSERGGPRTEALSHGEGNAQHAAAIVRGHGGVLPADWFKTLTDRGYVDATAPGMATIRISEVAR